MALSTIFVIEFLAACESRQLARIRDDVISGNQFFFGALGELRDGFWIGFVFDLACQGFKHRLDASLIGLVGFFELFKEVETAPGKFLHLAVLVLAYHFAVPDCVVVIGAEIVQQSDQSASLILCEGGGSQAQDDHQNKQCRENVVRPAFSRQADVDGGWGARKKRAGQFIRQSFHRLTKAAPTKGSVFSTRR